jgi:hypothetical protein
MAALSDSGQDQSEAEVEENPLVVSVDLELALVNSSSRTK